MRDLGMYHYRRYSPSVPLPYNSLEHMSPNSAFVRIVSERCSSSNLITTILNHLFKPSYKPR